MKTLIVLAVAAVFTLSLATGATPATAPVSTVEAVSKQDRIAFTRTMPESNYQTHLFVMNPDGSELRQLTDGDVIDRSSAWSPNGRRIVFARETDSGSDIYVVDADDSSLRRLTRNGDSRDPIWSPNGPTIMYSSRDRLFLIQADGTHRRLFRTRPRSSPGGPTRPSWSPDGTDIAFATRRGDVYVIDDGRLERRLTTGSSFYCPQWSPDGRKIAFVVMPHQYNWIYAIDASGGKEHPVTSHAYTESGFTWSPDSRRIIYARENSGGVFAIGRDGTGDRRLAPDPLRADLLAGGFSWSPNARRVAYANSSSGNGDIYVMNANGSGRRQLTSGPEVDGHPQWSFSPVPAWSC